MKFFVGIHQPCDAAKVDRAFVSVSRLEQRKGPFPANDWIMDCKGFSVILKNGGYPEPPEVYAGHIARFAGVGRLLAAVSQDFMCEPFMLERTKARAVAERMRRRGFLPLVDRSALVQIHQRWTVKRYDRLLRAMTGEGRQYHLASDVYLMPVLQGYDPAEYVEHLRLYGDRLPLGAWVGVGSVCKRNGDPRAIEAVLLAIKQVRPDLRLHGFGLKLTALQSALVRELLESADSMAWSYSARKKGRDGNSVAEAQAFARRVEEMPVEDDLLSWCWRARRAA